MGVVKTLPRVLILAEHPGWALHTNARHIQQFFASILQVDIHTNTMPPPSTLDRYDIVHALLWNDERYVPLLKPSTKLVKSLFSFRWKEQGMSKEDLLHTHFSHALAMTVPSMELLQELQTLPTPLYLVPEVVDTTLFTPPLYREHPAHRPLIAGWAGNTKDPMKQFSLVEEACEGLIEVRIADGKLSEKEMVHFYQSVDLILNTSKAEGCPRPLLEGMACGCFPVMFPVGIVPEVILHTQNGYIVEERTVEGMRQGLRWALQHAEIVQTARTENPLQMQRHRSASAALAPLATVYGNVLGLDPAVLTPSFSMPSSI